MACADKQIKAHKLILLAYSFSLPITDLLKHPPPKKSLTTLWLDRIRKWYKTDSLLHHPQKRSRQARPSPLYVRLKVPFNSPTMPKKSTTQNNITPPYVSELIRRQHQTNKSVIKMLYVSCENPSSIKKSQVLSYFDIKFLYFSKN